MEVGEGAEKSDPWSRVVEICGGQKIEVILGIGESEGGAGEGQPRDGWGCETASDESFMEGGLGEQRDDLLVVGEGEGQGEASGVVGEKLGGVCGVEGVVGELVDGVGERGGYGEGSGEGIALGVAGCTSQGEGSQPGGGAVAGEEVGD